MAELLDALKGDPAKVDALTVEALADLLDECATDHERLGIVERRARTRLRREWTTRVRGEDRLLTVDEAAARLGVTKDWLRRRPTLPFVVKLSEGAVRYSSRRIEQFIAQNCRERP